MKKLDALGNEIVMDAVYGFLNSSSGVSSITIGRAVKVTEKGMITIVPMYKAVGLYMDNQKPDTLELSKTITVKPMHMFPVDLTKVNMKVFKK